MPKFFNFVENNNITYRSENVPESMRHSPKREKKAEIISFSNGKTDDKMNNNQNALTINSPEYMKINYMSNYTNK